MTKTKITITKLLLVASLSLMLPSCGEEDKGKTTATEAILKDLDVNALEISLKNAILDAGKEAVGALFFLDLDSINTLSGLFDYINTDTSGLSSALGDDFSITNLIFDGSDYSISDLVPDFSLDSLSSIGDSFSNIDLVPGDKNLTLILENAGNTVAKALTIPDIDSSFLSGLLN